jgi:hypothetical protein
MFGSQGPWYYQAIAGITRAGNSTGWKNLIIHPQVMNCKQVLYPNQKMCKFFIDPNYSDKYF